MTLQGALFDFSGTLFHVESAESWLSAVADRLGADLTPQESARYARRLAEAGALPGGASPRTVPPHLAGTWQERDVSSASHHAAYVGLSRQVDLPLPQLHEALYARHTEPAAWRPYPDTAEVLGTLRRHGVAIAVISNIGWDVRPVFRAHGLDPLVDVYALSYEHGVQKPAPRLFRIACDALGVAPADTVMVGDNARADGGATRLGCRLHLVDNLPVDRRPDALRPVLDLVDGVAAAP